MSLTEPIIEGAYYERIDGVIDVARRIANSARFRVGSGIYLGTGESPFLDPHLTRRVYLVPTDPAEVVAELRGLHKTAKHMSTSLFEGITAQREHTGAAIAFDNAADLVAKKLGVTK